MNWQNLRVKHKRALTPSNIMAGFRRTDIWPLNYDALIHDMACSQAFDIDGQEDANATNNILSLSQGQSETMVDDNEHVSAIQYDNEAAKENMEVVGSDETHLQYADQRNNDSNGHVSATQYDNEAAEENMEVVGSDETHL